MLCCVPRDASTYEVEHLFRIEFADCVAVGAFHVVVVDFQHGLHGYASVFGEENRVHELAGIDACAVFTDDDASVVTHVGAFGEEVPCELRACGVRCVVVDSEARVHACVTGKVRKAAVIEGGAFAVQQDFCAYAADSRVFYDVRKANDTVCRLRDAEVAEAQGKAACRVCKEDFDVCIFADTNVEAFCGDFVHDFVVENFKAYVGALADVQDGVAEVVVAFEHGHFVCVFGDVLHHGLCAFGYREEGCKIRFLFN